MPSFLQTSFLWGLAALAVPVIIHLFFRLTTKRVELGTIRFLRSVLEENARRRKVMRWLLLALRMAFVALLAALFARPYISAVNSGNDKELFVILIDQSATMALKHENKPLIDQAIDEAKKLIERAGPQARFEVGFFDHDVQPIADSQVSSGTTANSVLTKLQAPVSMYGATSFGAAFAWARDICVKAPAGPKQLHLFTDLQRSGLDWIEVDPLPTDVTPYLHELGRSLVNNVAVTEVRTPRFWVHGGQSPTVRASILHSGTFALEEVPIVLEIGRVEEKGSEGRSLGASKNPHRTEFSQLVERISKRERVKLEPGSTVMLEFELPRLSEGLWQGRVRVEYEDDLPFDNQRFFAISATPAYQVLIVSGEPIESPISSETYFLNAALRLTDEGDSYEESPFAPILVVYSGVAGLPKLSGFDAVVLANVANISKPDAQQLASFVKGGGGLLVFTGDLVSAKSCSALADVGLTNGAIGDKKVSNDLPWRLAQWDDKHPIFAPFSDPQHGDLRRLTFAAYTKVSSSDDATVLARFGTGDPAVVEHQVGGGTTVWVMTSCGRNWSDWCRSRLYLPIIHQLLGYEVGLTAGGRVRSRLVDAEQIPNSELRNQNDSEQIRRARDFESQTSAVLAEARTPGVDQYDRFAEICNTSPSESDTDRCSRQELEDRFAVKFVKEDGTSVAQAAGLGNAEMLQDELWHWVACGLLGILLLEGFVGNRTAA